MLRLILAILVYNVTYVHVSATELASDSIFPLFSSGWRNQNNIAVNEQTFAGKLTLIAMAYTACPHSCPMTIHTLQKIHRDLALRGHKDIQLVLASFDPQRDLPQHTKAYLEKRNLPETTWTFLSPENNSVLRELAVVLGVHYQALADGEFSHSNVVALLDRKGSIRGKLTDLSGHTEKLLKIADTLAPSLLLQKNP